MPELPEYYTSKEVCQKLRITRKTLFRMIDRKELSHTRLSAGFRFQRQYIENFLQRRTVS